MYRVDVLALFALSVVLQIAQITSNDCLRDRSHGITNIELDDVGRSFVAFCDQRTENGGWTVILNRTSNQLSFTNRTEFEWRNGFGDLNGDHFLGLDKFAALANARSHELVVELHQNDAMSHRRYRGLKVSPANYDIEALNSVFDSETRYCRFRRGEKLQFSEKLLGWTRIDLPSAEYGCFKNIFADYDTRMCFNQGSACTTPLTALRLLIRPENAYMKY